MSWFCQNQAALQFFSLKLINNVLILAESGQFCQNQVNANKHQDDSNLKRFDSRRIRAILAEVSQFS